MPHDLTIERTAVAPNANARVLALLTAALMAVIVLLLIDVSADTNALRDTVISNDEDWHGNVKRSYWTP